MISEQLAIGPKSCGNSGISLLAAVSKIQHEYKVQKLITTYYIDILSWYHKSKPTNLRIVCSSNLPKPGPKPVKVLGRDRNQPLVTRLHAVPKPSLCHGHPIINRTHHRSKARRIIPVRPSTTDTNTPSQTNSHTHPQHHSVPSAPHCAQPSPLPSNTPPQTAG
jgi:hypothetical protein